VRLGTTLARSLLLAAVAALCGCGTGPAPAPAGGNGLAELRRAIAHAAGEPGHSVRFILPALAEAPKPTVQPTVGLPAHKLVIRPAETKEWGASLADVRAVLVSAAGELWRYFPEREMPPILVEPKGGPITLFQRGPKGEYTVRLDTGKLFWCQYAYQFAHEFCHILCNFRDGDKANKWFEEALCELASIFAIRAMARSWQTNPPYPNWRDFSKALQSYADDLVKKGQLPQGTTLPDWLKQNLPEMSKEPCIRDKNRVVSVALLPLFEKAPEHWEAVLCLNAGDSSGTRSFAVYLADWCAQAPRKHKGFIREIARLLAVELP